MLAIYGYLLDNTHQEPNFIRFSVNPDYIYTKGGTKEASMPAHIGSSGYAGIANEIAIENLGNGSEGNIINLDLLLSALIKNKDPEDASEIIDNGFTNTQAEKTAIELFAHHLHQKGETDLAVQKIVDYIDERSFGKDRNGKEDLVLGIAGKLIWHYQDPKLGYEVIETEMPPNSPNYRDALAEATYATDIQQVMKEEGDYRPWSTRQAGQLAVESLERNTAAYSTSQI